MDFQLERPRTVGEVLSDSMGLYKRHFLLFTGLSILCVVPVEVATWLLEPKLVDPTLPLAGWEAYTVYGIVSTLISYTLATATTTLAVAAAGQGQRPAIGEVFRRALPVLPAAIGTTAVAVLATLGGFVLLIVPGVWLGVLLTFSVQAAVAESTGVVGGVRRSIELVSGRFWSTLGTLLLVTLVMLAFALVAYLVTSAFLFEPVIYITATILVDVALTSVMAVVWAVLFFTWRATQQPAEPAVAA